MEFYQHVNLELWLKFKSKKPIQDICNKSRQTLFLDCALENVKDRRLENHDTSGASVALLVV